MYKMPHLSDVRERIDRLVDDALENTNFFRVESTAKGPVRSPIISVYVDGDQGINVDDCAKISRDLRRRIEEAEICPDGFELNVSSPGLERSLRLPRQYARHIGRTVRLEVLDCGKNSTLEGRLVGAGEDQVRIEGETGEVALPLGSIRRAVVKVAW